MFFASFQIFQTEVETLQTENMQYPKLAKLNLSWDSFFEQPGLDL